MISDNAVSGNDERPVVSASGSASDAAAQGAGMAETRSATAVSTPVEAVTDFGSCDALKQHGPSTAKLVINAITLQPVLEYLGPGWNQISPDLFAITTTVPEYVDTTMCPAPHLMWLRTTLVKFADGWRMYEYCKPLTELQSYNEKIRVDDSFQGVLTLAHTYAIPPEQLRFNVEGAVPALVAPAGMPAEEAEEEAIETEVPVDEGTGEAHPDDRAVEAVEFDAVVVDGVRLSVHSSLASIPAGCEALGLSRRGGKDKCLKRMLEHVKSQELLAATAATAKLERERTRHAVEQSRPEIPTQSMIDEHSLTHYPYKSWCETSRPVKILTWSKSMIRSSTASFFLILAMHPELKMTS